MGSLETASQEGRRESTLCALPWLDRTTLLTCKEEYPRRSLDRIISTIAEEQASTTRADRTDDICSWYNRAALVCVRAGHVDMALDIMEAELTLCARRSKGVWGERWTQAAVQAVINIARLDALRGNPQQCITLLASLAGCRLLSDLVNVIKQLDIPIAFSCQHLAATLSETVVIDNCLYVESIRACLFREDFGLLSEVLDYLQERKEPSSFQSCHMLEGRIKLALHLEDYGGVLSHTKRLWEHIKSNPVPDPAILVYALRAYWMSGKQELATQLAARLHVYGAQLKEQQAVPLARRLFFHLMLAWLELGQPEQAMNIASAATACAEDTGDLLVGQKIQLFRYASSGEHGVALHQHSCTQPYAHNVFLSQIAYGESDTCEQTRKGIVYGMRDLDELSKHFRVSPQLPVSSALHALHQTFLDPHALLVS